MWVYIGGYMLFGVCGYRWFGVGEHLWVVIGGCMSVGHSDLRRAVHCFNQCNILHSGALRSVRNLR